MVAGLFYPPEVLTPMNSMRDGIEALFERGALPERIIVKRRRLPRQPFLNGEQFRWSQAKCGYVSEWAGSFILLAFEVRKGLGVNYHDAAPAQQVLTPMMEALWR
jgi:hypothetical protein